MVREKNNLRTPVLNIPLKIATLSEKKLRKLFLKTIFYNYFENDFAEF